MKHKINITHKSQVHFQKAQYVKQVQNHDKQGSSNMDLKQRGSSNMDLKQIVPVSQQLLNIIKYNLWLVGRKKKWFRFKSYVIKKITL